MSPLDCLNKRHRQSFPRVSGDEPAQVTMRFNQEVFSPRERG